MLMLSVIGGILFFLLYCCLVVGKRSDRKQVKILQRNWGQIYGKNRSNK